MKDGNKEIAQYNERLDEHKRATLMATALKTSRLLKRGECLAILLAILCTVGSAQRPQEATITITLAG